MISTHKLHIRGMHCKACTMLVEDEIARDAAVASVHADLAKHTVTVEGVSEDELDKRIGEWNALLAPYKYKISKEQQVREPQNLLPAIAIGLVVLGLFLLLQRSGVLRLGFEGDLSPVTALVIGIIASLSTCLAVVGGLVLSLSAGMAEDVSTAKPFTLFHIGRLAGFLALGALLGALGGALAINPLIPAILGILVSLLMVVIGLNLIGIKAIGHLTPTLPKGIYKRLTSIENGTVGPVMAGVGTFFLPCGFTQSMQLAALGSGSAAAGATIMGMFALGTLPMLAALSFGSYKFSHSRFAPLFLASAGVVVVGLGIFTLLTGLAGLGIIPPLVII